MRRRNDNALVTDWGYSSRVPKRPTILVFDSGLGGLTVLREIVRTRPDARDIYVADSDEQAWREAGPEIARFWQLATDNVWRGDTVAPESLPKYTERYAYFPGGLTLQKMNDWGTSLIGSPETIIKKARAMIETAKPDSLVGMFAEDIDALSPGQPVQITVRSDGIELFDPETELSLRAG